jgi:hypothetical protein
LQDLAPQISRAHHPRDEVQRVRAEAVEDA